MTVIWFNVRVEGTDESKLGVLKTWLESIIETQDLDENLSDGSVILQPDAFHPGGYLLISNLFLLDTVPVDKYFDKVDKQWNKTQKAGITSILVKQYDDCSHDSSAPSPCNPIVRLEWNA